MRSRLVEVFFLCFLCNVQVRSVGAPSRSGDPATKGIRSKEEEWKELLSWFRELKTKENRSEVWDFEEASEEEEAAFGDDAFDGGLQAKDSEMEWDRLVRGTFPSSEEGLEGEKAVGGVSLAFVFDSTGSMSDELNQVKAGASKILAALRDHPDAPIYNYIWLPFSDPVIGPMTVTTDHKLFQERIHDVTVTGGGDCPEMSIGAIKKALEASLPNSYIYVFTDASAKDHRLQNEVLSLVQRKQAQVVFILTGDCSDLSEPSYTAYERIAESSSGQIYRLSRNEVKEVLEYVNVAIQPHVVSLLSLNKPAPNKWNPDKLEVLVDESLKQFTVSVSGVNASINVRDPKGENVDGPPKLENVLNLANIKVVNVKEPDPGSWNVFINSDSNYTVRSTGLSKINFNHGFSTMETVNLKETNYRPLKGARSFILIRTSDTEKVYNLTSIDFVSLNGNVLQHLQLTPVVGYPGLYKGGSFVPPEEFFYLLVTGFGQDGLPLKRITSTAVSAQLPEKPIITMSGKVVGRVNTSGSLKCYVESVVPFTVRWYKNGNFIGEEKNCSETCEVKLNIEKFTIQSEGSYSCSARNVAGFESKTLSLTVTGDAPSVTVKSPVVAVLGDAVLLNCAVESKIPFVVKWSQFTARNQHSGVLHPVSKGIKLENNTLLIDSVKAEDEGWYVCSAANKGGESQGRVLLVVKEPLIVRVEPSSLSFVEGDSARFTCIASGKPEPRLEWVKDQQPIKDEDPSVFVEEINGNLNLVIDYLEKRNAGVYFCNAINAKESASATGELIYTEKPKVKAKENNLMVKAGSQVILKCVATGAPEPTISWYKRDTEITDDPRFQVEKETLVIPSTLSSDTGEYSCVARNDLGSDVDYIGLIVGSPPTFLPKPKDQKIQVNHNGTIACSAIGVPPPKISWRRSNGRDLDKSRMFISASGALKITKMKVEDAGQYVCTAENVFGSIGNQVSIKVTGVEKPVVDKTIELRNVEASSGNELIIPCGIILGNPPGALKWFKNGIEIQEPVLESSGNLVIRNASVEDRGSYTCWAQNAAGNSSRSYEVLITEIPKIRETNEAGLKSKVGGEIVIPCPVEGFPVPTVTWTRNGLPLPVTSTIFQDESGSLIIKNLSEENSGVYVCTAINAVGSASKATSVYVQVPPVFPVDVQDPPINVVEGHVVVLNCNASAIPEPTIRWFRNGEPLLQDGDQPKILRFVANMDDTGVFSCVVENEAGSSSKEFNVTILVPPKILGNNNEESIKAKAGVPITLLCNVFGVPAPTILWQRNGMYLTQNTSEVTISDSGTLTIRNVTKESAGAYTCDAENLGGITQRIYYLQVNYPPKIIVEKNTSNVITLTEGEEYSLGCLVEGNPKPNVIWKKNGLPILGQHHDLIVLEDNTLVFLQVTAETTGVYKCEAVSSEGSAFTQHDIKVIVPPSLSSDSYPTKLEVNEGDSLALSCPVAFSEPPANIQWFKDGEPLDLLLHERSDEAQMKLSPDQRTLTIIESHPSDRGNYSCVATNAAGRTDARFLIDILMTPHFEEFNHVAHRTILTGGEVTLNCSVSGNPQPKVTWRKENAPITPHNVPGVHVSLDKHHLVILNGRVHHSGTYICVATNKVNTKEREFYVTVLEPPQIGGPLTETIDVMEGDNVTLKCEGSGVPAPTFTWTKEDETKTLLNNTENYLIIPNVSCSDSGIYLCDITNLAGTRTKHFEINVLQLPQIENQERVEELTGFLGGNLTMKCKTRGNPKPEITWLHNGHLMSRVKRSVLEDEDGDTHVWKLSDDGYASLTLTNIQERNKGVYTLVASNRAGIGEKKFKVRVVVPPKPFDGHPGTKHLKVVHPFPVVLKCPLHGNPPPEILWYFKDINGGQVEEDENVVVAADELRIKKPSESHSGIYICIAQNPGGRFAYYFNLSVVEPPRIEGKETERLSLLVNDTLTLHCNATGGAHMEYTWFHSSAPVADTPETLITNSGKTLISPHVSSKNSGTYTCLVTNDAGSAEATYQVDVQVPPALKDEPRDDGHKIVRLHRPFSLVCSFSGSPPPEITWLKDGQPFVPHKWVYSVLPDNSFLRFLASRPEDAGNYTCVAQNLAGKREMKFEVDVMVSAEWSHWSAWSECSVSCGLGERRRERSCNFDGTSQHLRVNKSKCTGDDIEKQKCFKECQVNGGWGSWGSWTGCSVTCGKGIRRRHRMCDSPKPQNDGKTCEGEENEEEVCNVSECPFDGQWSEWSQWSSCSNSCGGGVAQRIRKCDSSSSQRGGTKCSGQAIDVKVCNLRKCQDDGSWSPWTEWTSCSRTCGKGHRKRQRFCKTTKREETCAGDNFQMANCFVGYCHDETSSSFYDFPDADARRRNNWFSYDNFVASRLGKDEDSHSFSNGHYLSRPEPKVVVDKRAEEDEALTVEIEVKGELPLVEPHASVIVKPLVGGFLERSQNGLYAMSQGNITIMRRNPPDATTGNRTPYPVNLSPHYDSYVGIPEDDRCLPGFSYDPLHKHCEDVDECDTSENLCENDRICENTFGSFKCICANGFRETASGCVDVDECSEGQDRCSHFCHNTIGSYKCSCPARFHLSPDLKTCHEASKGSLKPEGDSTANAKPTSLKRRFVNGHYGGHGGRRIRLTCRLGYSYVENECRDKNECEQADVCDIDETCVNLPGSYQCLSTPCPEGYQRVSSNKNCIRQCTQESPCRTGASISEAVVFRSLTLSTSGRHVLRLDEVGASQRDSIATKFQVTESAETFQVHPATGALYALRGLNRDTLYRVNVEARSYDSEDILLHFTRFVLFVTAK